VQALDPHVYSLATALGIGLLIGSEREKRKGTGPNRRPGGIRTFALVSLGGALAALQGEAWLVAAGLVVVGAYGVVAYLRDRGDDPGLTTEVAFVVAYLIGALTIDSPALAAGIGVVVTIMLAARSRLHRLVQHQLSERELHDGLLLAAAALVVLPLLPNRAIDPWRVFNPHVIWLLAVLVMAINAVGYVALRTLGARRGLPLAGLTAGFVSSTATHGAMGSRARAQPELRRAAVAGAALSSVATTVQMLIVLAVVNLEVLRAVAAPMLLAGAAALGWGGLYTLHSLRQPATEETLAPGRAFEIRTALVFTGTVTLVMFAAALLTDWAGPAGGVIGVVVAGLADTHSAAASAASLVSGGTLPLAAAVPAVLGAFSLNALSKLVVAYATGGSAFGNRLAPGLLLMVALAWAGTWIPTL
jgi:uncharacterized membrane protein (DUF4010 family)